MNLLELIRKLDDEATEKVASVNPFDLIIPEDKTAGFVDKATKVLTAPVRNIYGGAKDYFKLRPQRAEEIKNLHTELNAIAEKHNGSVPESVAKKVWKKAKPTMMEDGVKVTDLNAEAKSTQHRIGEAKGRVIGGVLQAGIPGIIGYKMLKKPNVEAAPGELPETNS